MSLSAGDRVGPYEVTGPLGAGGMGIVLRATDTQLGRDVALKIVPDDTTAGIRAGAPTPVFQTDLTADSTVEQYAVAHDGTRFLVPTPRFLVPTPVGGSPAALVLVQGWSHELNRLAPMN